MTDLAAIDTNDETTPRFWTRTETVYNWGEPPNIIDIVAEIQADGLAHPIDARCRASFSDGPTTSVVRRLPDGTFEWWTSFDDDEGDRLTERGVCSTFGEAFRNWPAPLTHPDDGETSRAKPLDKSLYDLYDHKKAG